MDNPADLASGLGLFQTALYLLLFAVLVVTGHGLWRCSKERFPKRHDSA